MPTITLKSKRYRCHNIQSGAPSHSVVVIGRPLRPDRLGILPVQQFERALAGVVVAAAEMTDVDEPVEGFGNARVGGVGMGVG